MKYELETIPVWEALKSEPECFLCHLMKEAEEHALDYHLGSSVMHPETRVRVNRTGFCPHHWDALISRGKAHPLALIGHTYVETTLEEMAGVLGRLRKAKPGRKTVRASDELLEVYNKRKQGCLVCEMMRRRLDRYLFTTIKLCSDDADFRTAFLAGKGLCLHHMEPLLVMSRTVLDASAYKRFSEDLANLVEENLRNLERDVWWMTQKYKAEHASSPWNGCEDAQRRLVKKLIGEGRIWERS